MKQVFTADFVLILDWLDPSLVEGVHYLVREYGLTLAQDSETYVFNPKVVPVNANKEVKLVGGSDIAPRIAGLQDGTPWMQKIVRYRGQLCCDDHDFSWFPFEH